MGVDRFQGMGYASRDGFVKPIRRERPLRVAVSALSAREYGGDTYLRAILPELAHISGVEFFLLTRHDHYDALCPKDGAIKPVHCQIPTSVGRPLWEQIVLPRLLRKLSVDVIYTANNVGTLASSIPCVIAIRNMVPLVPIDLQAPWPLIARDIVLQRMTALSLQRAQRIVVVSEFVRDQVVARGISPDKLDVIYHGVDDMLPVNSGSSKNGDGGYVASASKFVSYANLATLFRAFARMRVLGYAGELRFAGGPYDSNYERKIRDLVQELGLGDRVRFLGYIPRAEVQSLVSGCDVFLFASTLEACPFTVLEAMRQGVPIVATTARPMPEFLDNAALYVNPYDHEAFAEAGFRITKDPALATELRCRARQRASSFRWKDSVHKLVAVLGRAAASKRC